MFKILKWKKIIERQGNVMFKIKLWGMGSGAKNMINFLMSSGDFEVLGVTDSFVSGGSETDFYRNVPIYTPEKWRNIDCDYAVICAVNHEKELKEKIVGGKLGVDSEKIYFSKEFKILMVSKIYSDYQNNDLWKYFISNHHKPISKWIDYFRVYDKYFAKYRNTDVVMCEIGVCKGGSLQMWKKYLGGSATIIGIDINEKCKQLEEDQIHIEIGSQSDARFWDVIKQKYPKIDILLDDGGHTMEQQIATFENMFGHISDGGIYLCEDVHTSYWGKYGGGYKKSSSYIEYTKDFIDAINAYHSETKELPISDNSNYIMGLHYYDSIVVIEKQKRLCPPFVIEI